MGKRKLPFGYHIRDGQIRIKENEAQAVQMIFDCYTAGMSYSELTDKLNRQGIPYVPGKPWNKNMLARVLQDERYMGSAAYPQIITPKSFQYETTAHRLGSAFTDAGVWGVELAYDGVHFSEKGHLAFAKGIQTALDSLL